MDKAAKKILALRVLPPRDPDAIRGLGSDDQNNAFKLLFYFTGVLEGELPKMRVTGKCKEKQKCLQKKSSGEDGLRGSALLTRAAQRSPQEKAELSWLYNFSYNINFVRFLF